MTRGQLVAKRLVSRIKRLKSIVEQLLFDFKFLLSMPITHKLKLMTLLPKSKSQLRQDLFVLSNLSFMQKGYFVEFGAASGRELSNTYLLETERHWTGILAEPANCWHGQLEMHRPNSLIERTCVWRETGPSINFVETSDRELSTIAEFNVCNNSESRKNEVVRYQVETISLLDLLEKHRAPSHINYLSIDTEGSEFEILKSFDFTMYSFDVITCEHNYTSDREKIYDLLVKNGYERVHPKVSLWDDWYVKS